MTNREFINIENGEQGGTPGTFFSKKITKDSTLIAAEDQTEFFLPTVKTTKLS